MDERDMLDKIKESAGDVEVPDALKPHQIAITLKTGRNKKRKIYRNIAVAACLCFCFGLGGAAYKNSMNSQADSKQSQRQQASDRQMIEQEEKDGTKDMDVAVDDSRVLPLQKIGKMYTLASDYGDVYDVLKKTSAREEKYRENMRKEVEIEDSSKDSVMFEDSSSTGMAVQIKNEYEGEFAATENTAVKEYSSTNLQVDGVDESDIVKTDGNYIYVVQNDCIQVIDIRNRLPEAGRVIDPNLNEDTDTIHEMYVSNHVLTLIIQSDESVMRQTIEDLDRSESAALGNIDAVEDAYYLKSNPVTKVMTYDITDPEKPLLQDTTQQDGWYQDSRKIGNRLYLFTNDAMDLTAGLKREEAITEDAVQGWIPCVGGKAVSADCIYLPKLGNDGCLMASIELADRHRILDTKLVVSGYVQIYVTSGSAYFYYTDIINGIEKTRIARFALEADGTIQAKGASTLKGCIMDTFALHERNGYLQVLTSVRNANIWIGSRKFAFDEDAESKEPEDTGENRVYVLDESMATAGKLTGLAKGERIYSARFTGDIGYFVTYRETDPLFTVDFSNPQAPKVIGELKVTGFSDYLHFWGDQKLLGIGQETDPENGNMIGIKLSMFDISDPTNVVEEGRIVLEDADDSEALNQYKSVLIDQQKNIIALTTQTWATENHGYQKHYRVFSYENGKFISLIQRPFVSDGEYDDTDWRSVYVRDMLYAVCEKQTIAFDMEDHFKEIGEAAY